MKKRSEVLRIFLTAPTANLFDKHGNRLQLSTSHVARAKAMASSAPTAGLDAADVSVAGVAGGGGAGGGAGVTSGNKKAKRSIATRSHESHDLRHLAAAVAAVPPLQQLVAGLSAATLGSTGGDALVPCGPRESAPPDGDDARM